MRSNHLYSIILAAALVAAATLTSCTNEDNAVVENLSDNVIHFTATLAPKGNNTRSVDADGHTEWVTGEQIAIYYQTTESENTFATAIADVTADTDGSATFSATLTGAKDGGTVKFVYPASLHNGAGDIDESLLRTKQNGRLNDGDEKTKNISHNFDAATASGTLVVSNNVATVSGSVAMQNRVCICKFKLRKKNTDGTIESFTDDLERVTIDIDGRTYDFAPYQYRTRQYFYLAMLPATNATAVIRAYFGGETSPSTGVTTYKHVYSSNINNVTLAAGTFYTNVIVALSEVQSITGSKNSTVTVHAGETLVLDGANISVSSGPGIVCLGDATIVLIGVNNVESTSDSDYPGIQAGPEGTTLSISGSGKLTVTGGNYGVGIGSDESGTCGNITISDGTITATGGFYAAGIGTGYYGICGSINIIGGSIMATGGTYGAGIGVGQFGSCDNITISGGTVEATGGTWGAGIGTGADSQCGDITISGGTVTATGGSSGAGIGTGKSGKCGAITINGENTHIMATKGDDAPYSIGLGYLSTCGTVTIGGRVYYDDGSFENGGESYLATSPFYWQWPTTTP